MIVVHNAFVYIHSPKTGGTFVTEMLRRIAGTGGTFVTEGVWRLTGHRVGSLLTERLRSRAGNVNRITIEELPGLKHAGIRKIPEAYNNLQIVTNVRNVFEHYVSRYTFRWWAEPKHFRQRFHMDRVLKDFPAFPNITFPEFLRLFNEWSYLRNMPEKKANELVRLNVGFNSWVLARLLTRKPIKLFRHLDNHDNQVLINEFMGIRFLRTESLNTDLYKLLQELGVKEDNLRPILQSKPILPKKGGRGKQKETWHNHFGEDDIAFVMQKDRLYFRLFPDMCPSRETG